MEYKVIDNVTGIIRETDDYLAYVNIINDLKEDYTKKEWTEEDGLREEPFYIITSYRDIDNGTKITYFDIRKGA